MACSSSLLRAPAQAQAFSTRTARPRTARPLAVVVRAGGSCAPVVDYGVNTLAMVTALGVAGAGAVVLGPFVPVMEYYVVKVLAPKLPSKFQDMLRKAAEEGIEPVIRGQPKQAAFKEEAAKAAALEAGTAETEAPAEAQGVADAKAPAEAQGEAQPERPPSPKPASPMGGQEDKP